MLQPSDVGLLAFDFHMPWVFRQPIQITNLTCVIVIVYLHLYQCVSSLQGFSHGIDQFLNVHFMFKLKIVMFCYGGS